MILPNSSITVTASTYHSIAVFTTIMNCDWICENGIIRTIKKYGFSILKAVYLHNAWYVFYAILRQPMVIQLVYFPVAC